MDILESIIEHKRLELKQQQTIVSLEEIKDQAMKVPQCRGFRQALEVSTTGIIAEFKRCSPSKGPIFEEADPAEVVTGYQQAGAAACSVLTERAFFKAHAGDFKSARMAATLPLLRKDFIIDEYQVYETKAMGADAILLITAILKPSLVVRLSALAKELGLDTILEVHKKEELACINENIDIVGINNRNLGSFHTDVQNSFFLASQAKNAAKKFHTPPLLIAESGISDYATVKKLRSTGFRGFLIGELFMKDHTPKETLSKFLSEANIPET